MGHEGMTSCSLPPLVATKSGVLVPSWRQVWALLCVAGHRGPGREERRSLPLRHGHHRRDRDGARLHGGRHRARLPLRHVRVHVAARHGARARSGPMTTRAPRSGCASAGRGLAAVCLGPLQPPLNASLCRPRLVEEAHEGFVLHTPNPGASAPNMPFNRGGAGGPRALGLLHPCTPREIVRAVTENANTSWICGCCDLHNA